MPWSPTQSGNMNPGRFFPGCSGQVVVGGLTGVFIPYSALESYKTATSGDIRELTYSILDKVTSGIASLNSSDRPSQFSISRSTVISDTTAQKTFTVTIGLNASNTTYDVRDE
jgi:hypothetical protein